MYIFIKIFDNENHNGDKPFIIEEKDLLKALDKICEKYYGMKFSNIMEVIHYPIFLNVIKTIKEL